MSSNTHHHDLTDEEFTLFMDEFSEEAIKFYHQALKFSQICEKLKDQYFMCELTSLLVSSRITSRKLFEFIEATKEANSGGLQHENA